MTPKISAMERSITKLTRSIRVVREKMRQMDDTVRVTRRRKMDDTVRVTRRRKMDDTVRVTRRRKMDDPSEGYTEEKDG